MGVRTDGAKSTAVEQYMAHCGKNFVLIQVSGMTG